MGTFSKQSLEELKGKIDLIEVLRPHVELKKAGGAYKALCPFHEEKTPSFVIQKGDNHYHCFGCGAHGDAIQFLMTHLRLNFVETVEHLAEMFHVQLEEVETSTESKGASKTALKEALEHAASLYQFFLLHTLEGHAGLDYLYSRGVDLDFIRTFGIGFAPRQGGLLQKVLSASKIAPQVMEEAGLLSRGKEFFFDRITIPIRDPSGHVIGFSARKFKPDTFGGKYINTPETALFKKSKVLFGLSYSRKTIAKTRKALIVEGQLDALRLIHNGFNWTVAGQGTAFGEGHVKELMQLGVREVFLAFDGDSAGKEASIKVGQLFQKEGIEVKRVEIPEGMDPDLFLQEKGPTEWQKRLDQSIPYLDFFVSHLSLQIDQRTPAGKNELVQTVAQKIREWDHPLMVHEGLRTLARLTQTPEAMIQGFEEKSPQIYIQRSMSVKGGEVDPDRILEADLLRWLFLKGTSEPKLIELIQRNLTLDHFRLNASKDLFVRYFEAIQKEGPVDLLTLAIGLDGAEAQLFLAEILQKRVNLERAIPCTIETIQKILERSWMLEREEIKLKIYSGQSSEAEVIELAKRFDAIKKKRPSVVTGEEP